MLDNYLYYIQSKRCFWPAFASKSMAALLFTVIYVKNCYPIHKIASDYFKVADTF